MKFNPSLTLIHITDSRPMKFILNLVLLSGFLIGAIASAESRPPNVLLICVDDLRPELGCYGKDYIQSPHIDALAKRGRLFNRHYVQAPTCGASRFALLTGLYGPKGNDALFARAKSVNKAKDVRESFPEWFRQHGYTTVSVGKVSHHPGGCGGADWDEESQLEMPNAWDRHLLPAGPWQHPRGAMHGLANGEIRTDPSKMDVYQSTEGPDSIYPDGMIVDQAVKEMNLLAKENAKPFLLAVGIIRPHLPFGAPAKYMKPYESITLPPIPHPTQPEGKSTWHGSGEFMRYNRWQKKPNDDEAFATLVRKHYAACVSYADAMVGKLINQLEQLKLRDDTIIVLWGDHGWHLGEYGVWGKHTLFEESLRSPLIVSYPDLPTPGVPTNSIVETIDLFPTLCDLTKVPVPKFVHGTSIRSIIESPSATGHPAVSYFRGDSIRNDRFRLVVLPGGQKQLYDFSANEAINVAGEHPEVVKQMEAQMKSRLALKQQ